jgi:hypothetical protein
MFAVVLRAGILLRPGYRIFNNFKGYKKNICGQSCRRSVCLFLIHIQRFFYQFQNLWEIMGKHSFCVLDGVAFLVVMMAEIIGCVSGYFLGAQNRVNPI